MANKSNKCSICSKGFGVPSELDKHRAQAHNMGQTQTKMYRCDMCVYQSRDVFNRNQHKINAHFNKTLQKPFAY